MTDEQKIFITALAGFMVGIMSTYSIRFIDYLTGLRRKRIARNIDTKRAFFPFSPYGELIENAPFEILIKYDNKQKNSINVHVSEIIINNISGTNLQDFKFGVSCGDDIICVSAIGEDALHIAEITPKTVLKTTQKPAHTNLALFDNPVRFIEITCRPFYKNNKYTIFIWLDIPNDQDKVHDIQLIPPEGVKWIKN